MQKIELNKQVNVFEQWEKMQANIRLLRKDFNGENLDKESKDDIAKDLAKLIKKKDELATALGM